MKFKPKWPEDWVCKWDFPEFTVEDWDNCEGKVIRTDWKPVWWFVVGAADYCPECPYFFDCAQDVLDKAHKILDQIDTSVVN